MKRFVILTLVVGLLLPAFPARAQDGTCGSAPPPQLTGARHAQVVAGQTAPVYNAMGGTYVGEIQSPDEAIYLIDGPQCYENVWWVHISLDNYYDNWVPESVDGVYVLEPYQFIPAPPVALGVPMTEPVMSNPDVPVSTINPAGNPQNVAFVAWDWAAYTENAWFHPPDPMALQLPAAYAGDLPVLPVNLDTVHFVQDANLTPDQLALLAQNGFVVVPGDAAQFDYVYRDDLWPTADGKGNFITTDALLHSLYLSYQNALMALEVNEFYGSVANFVAGGYQAAEAQLAQVAGTSLETPARNAAVYYAVALLLLADGQASYFVGYEQKSGFHEGDLIPTQVLAQADPAILELAQPLVEMARAAEGRLVVPILENDYEEDFSQYKPRSYYAGNPLLESYFRSMMWLGRITFRARSEQDTLSGLMVLRALVNSPDGYQDWQNVADVLTFLVGPMDDYSATEYLPLVNDVYGADFALDALADPAKLSAFIAGVKELPGPRINSIPLPLGIQADEVDEFTRGFRLFGQRFTFDGYVMQQLIYPEVGTGDMARGLPLGLDVAAVLGSDIAYTLADEAGATEFENYTENLSALRDEVNGMDGDAWLENLYGGWLWALQPLLVRDAAAVPPMMQTDAWRRKDIHTSLGSWTELKHATLLYAEQAMGGLGGGGHEPPVITTSYVEPNPLVFARIAIVAATLDQGLETRGFYRKGTYTNLTSVSDALTDLALLSARLAEIARQEVAGEPISHEDLYWMQENFRYALWNIRYTIEQWLPDPPETSAVVADVASNANAAVALEEATGLVDTIYVITNGPYGLHLTHGGVYSYYEFVQPIDQRMTDAEWNAQITAGDLPPRPTWIDLYFSE